MNVLSGQLKKGVFSKPAILPSETPVSPVISPAIPAGIGHR
jgi:hypothetical protein